MDEIDKNVLRKLLEFTNGIDPGSLRGVLNIPIDKVTLSLEKLEGRGYAESYIILSNIRTYRPTLSGRRYFDPFFLKIKYYFAENWLPLITMLAAVIAAMPVIWGMISNFK